MVILALLEAVREAGPPPARTWWELFLIMCGSVLTVAAFVALVFRVAKPHLETFVRRAVEPIVHSLNEVHREVKPDHGESLFDQARTAASSATRVEDALSDLHDTTHAINRKLGKIDAQARMTRSVLDQHVREASDSLSALRTHYGIDVGPTRDRTARTRREDYDDA